MKHVLLTLCALLFFTGEIFSAQTTPVTNWLLLGPLPNPPRQGMSYYDHKEPCVGLETDWLEDAGGERAVIPEPGDQVQGPDGMLTWKPVLTENGLINFREHFEKRSQVVVYAYSEIFSSTDRTALFGLGSDDGVHVYLNGKLEHHHVLSRGVSTDDDILELSLKKGINRLLVKVEQGNGGWGLVFREINLDKAVQKASQNIDIEMTVDKFFGFHYPILKTRPLPETVLRELPSLSVEVIDGKGIKVFDGQWKPVSPLEIRRLLAVRGPFLITVISQPPEGEKRIVFKTLASDANRPRFEDLVQRAEGLLKDSAGAEGILRWRIQELQKGLKADRVTEEAGFVRDYFRLLKTVLLIEKKGGANLPEELRGRFEWGYVSKLDGRGIPLSLRIPDNYDPERKYPLHLFLHGKGGTHDPPKLPESWDKDFFRVDVCGRGFAGGYYGNMETDALEALEYAKTYFNIDEDRVHLFGHSMGGGGSWWVGSRHPHLFATVRPISGFCFAPLENMLHLPVTVLHSKDDPIVPVETDTAAARLLSAMGGEARSLVSDGFGHGTSPETNIVAENWTRDILRVTNPGEVSYTALDGGATEAYWAKILEWGHDSAPAKFRVRVIGSALSCKLENISVLQIDLTKAPVQDKKMLKIVVNKQEIGELEAPFPDKLFLYRDNAFWKTAKLRPLPVRRPYAPGGMNALYHGEPLTYVYGTGGSKETQKAAEKLARRFAKCGSPPWGNPLSDYMSDFNDFPVKADTELTDDDFANSNIFVIGEPHPKSFLATIMVQLPILLGESQIMTDDGYKWSLQERGFSIFYRNPYTPSRLLFWMYSRDPHFYREASPVLSLQSYQSGPDFLLTQVNESRVVAARRFRSDWNWVDRYGASPFMSVESCDSRGAASVLAARIRDTLGVDHVLCTVRGRNPGDFSFSPGESRMRDFENLFYNTRIAVVNMTAREASDLNLKLVEKATGPAAEILPAPVPSSRQVSIAMSPHHYWRYVFDNGYRIQLNFTAQYMREIILAK